LKRTSGLLLACIFLAAAAARAEDPAESAAPDITALFQRGRVELLAGGGYGADNSRSYLILALGGGYFLRDGLSAGVNGEAWLGSRPQIYDASPYVRYVFLDSTWRYKPYAGAFYRRTSYASGSSPVDSGGARAGFVFPLSNRAYLTAGLAYERNFQAATNVDSSRDFLYPELGLQFSF
jgi:hypothetical protein